MPKDNKLKNNKKNNLPMILVILDGWGLARPNQGNAVTLAQTPTMNGLVRKFPNTTLCASGECVGLMDGQPGNSEAGHMNIGAGRLVEQDDYRISRSLKDGTFFKNAGFMEAILHAKKRKSKIHIMGMISNGMSPHSNPEHLYALIDMLHQDGFKEAILHLFTDGRDSPKYSALKLVQDLETRFNGGIRISTIMGRFYAMDRTKKWDRTEQAYNALTSGNGKKAISATAAITAGYNSGESDEFIEPYVIAKPGEAPALIEENDSVIFFNLRSDRSRQLAKVFVQENFNKMNPGSFKRKKKFSNVRFVAMTDFGPDLDSIITAYPSIDLHGTIPMVLKDLKQLYIAETEKYAHVTYFFNGGYSGTVDGETQFMIPSPQVKFYNETPAMSSHELADAIVHNVKNKKYDFTVLNFAAPDMIGHTGDLAAGIKCCSVVDRQLARIVKAYGEARGTVVITADHGNVEEMINLETGEIDTEHSTNPVPFIIVNSRLKKKIKLSGKGILGDIAPTIMQLLGRDKPVEMTGKSLIKKVSSK